MARKRRSVKKIVLISLLVLGIISFFSIWNRSGKKAAVAIDYSNIGPINFRPVAQWPSYGAPYLPYGSGPYRIAPSAGWIQLEEGLYVDPISAAFPPGGDYVQEEGILPIGIQMTKYYDPEGHTTMDGFTVKSVSFRIKTKGEFDFYVSRTNGSEYFHFNFPDDKFYAYKLDEALIDGTWHTVEKDLDLPSGYQKEDYEFKVFSFGYDFNGENEFQIDDIIITSDEGVEFVIDDFEYDDVIGNHGWELAGKYDEEYFNPLIPVYDDELDSRVFVCNDSYRIKGPGRWVYKAGDRTYNLVTPGIAFQYLTPIGSSTYSNTNPYRVGSWNYGYQGPTYAYPYNYGLSGTNFGYQNPTFTFPNMYGFSNQSPAYNFSALPFSSYGSRFYPTNNFGYGYGSGFGISPLSSWGFGYPASFPVFGGGTGWY